MPRANRAAFGARVRDLGIALLAILLLPVAARAGVDGDLRGGYYADSELGYFGGGLLAGLDRHWYFNPNLEVAPSSGVDLFTINGDFHYDFAATSGASFWAGGGPALLVMNGEGPNDDSETDFGINLLAGVGARRGEVRPFGQFKTVLADDSQFVLTGGIRF